MKTIQFKTLLFLLLVSFAFISCSSDDDSSSEPKNDNKKGQASAMIEVNDQNLQFSSNNENSFATIVNANIGENQVDQLVIVMTDDNSDIVIVAQVAPAPDNSLTIDLTQPITDNYFFGTSVVLNGENSTDQDSYGVGSYQGDDIVVQSSGLFKITSISNTDIQGTFNMTLFNSYDVSNTPSIEEITVAEGEFDLPIIELSQEDLENFGLD